MQESRQSGYKLSACQTTALTALEGQENIFLTGGAGTGKSFLLREYLKNKSSKDFPVLASTGVAAILVGGRTFHSFFGLGIMEGGPEETLQKAMKNRRTVKRIQKISGFVLDEISMIPGIALAVAERICQMARSSNEPWGGLRVIVVGDFSQLPPVHRGQGSPWAFLNIVWQRSGFQMVNLETIMRTEDNEYINVLTKVREGIVDGEVKNYLDERVIRNSGEFDPDEFSGTRLFGRRNKTEQYNLQKLDSISNSLHSFTTSYYGDKKVVDSLKRISPLPEIIHLKKDCLIMMRQNDPKQRWVNGSLGYVKEFMAESLLIELLSGSLVEIEKSSYSLQNAEGVTVATAENYPVNLAYASTIHKAQGATFDRMVVDLKRLWEPGQAYVALSRVKSGAGLFIEEWDHSSIKVDQHVVDFYRGE